MMNNWTPPVFLHDREQAALGLWTPENNRVATCLLTADELAALKAAKHGWELYILDEQWVPTNVPLWRKAYIYRAKPAPGVALDTIPWDAIDPSYVWAVRHESGVAIAMTDEPGKNSGGGWWPNKGLILRLSGCLTGYLRGTCDWRDSLQQRPQPAATGAVTEPLAYGTRYWVSDGSCIYGIWNNHPVDFRRMRDGVIRLTEAAARAHAMAMVGLKAEGV